MSSHATPTAPAAHSARQDIRTIGLIGLGHCTSHFHHMLLPPLFPVFIREFGFSYAELGLLLTVVGFGMGCSYPPSQITVQVAAGPARLGAAAASVQYARTLGAAVATTLLGAVLFGTLAAGHQEVADLFARLVREGPAALMALLGEAERTALRAGLTEAFRLGFLTAAAIAGCGALIAWRVPVRRI